MTKDPSIERYIARSRTKIENRVPEAIETTRNIERTQQTLERSRILLDRFRDPLEFASRPAPHKARRRH